MLCTKHGRNAKTSKKGRHDGMQPHVDDVIPHRAKVVEDVVEAERQHGQWAV